MDELARWADGEGLALVKRTQWNTVYRAARDAGTVEDLDGITVMPVVLEELDGHDDTVLLRVDQ